MSKSPLKDINEFLPVDLRKKFKLVSPSTGQPLMVHQPTFATDGEVLNASKLTERKLEALYRKKHPMVRKIEVSSVVAKTSAPVEKAK